ncbi:hypothetical protein QM012_005520 [Aureobasidium pullulans]|uniref:J domain-containing protein n=1 Tax=Aureobasidium pullulans TaxID=5580 RepID=A0ABR0T5S2_AURPU
MKDNILIPNSSGFQPELQRLPFKIPFSNLMAWYKRDHRDVEDEAGVGLIGPESGSAEKHSTRSRQSWISKSSLSVMLVLSNLAWAAFCLMLWREMYLSQKAAHIDHERPEADFVSTAALPYKRTTIEFDDLLLFNYTSHAVYRKMDSTLPLYFGRPSPEIDAAWADLLQYEYPAITPEEIALNPFLSHDMKRDKHPVTGKYHFALDVFHNLHCLNAVRKELDKDYYAPYTISPDKDFYQVLGLQPNASAVQIKKAWQDASREHHPDKNPHPDSTKRMQEINHAYDILSNPEKRKQHDQTGEYPDITQGHCASCTNHNTARCNHHFNFKPARSSSAQDAAYRSPIQPQTTRKPTHQRKAETHTRKKSFVEADKLRGASNDFEANLIRARAEITRQQSAIQQLEEELKTAKAAERATPPQSESKMKDDIIRKDMRIKDLERSTKVAKDANARNIQLFSEAHKARKAAVDKEAAVRKERDQLAIELAATRSRLEQIQQIPTENDSRTRDELATALLARDAALAKTAAIEQRNKDLEAELAELQQDLQGQRQALADKDAKNQAELSASYKARLTANQDISTSQKRCEDLETELAKLKIRLQQQAPAYRENMSRAEPHAAQAGIKTATNNEPYSFFLYYPIAQFFMHQDSVR